MKRLSSTLAITLVAAFGAPALAGDSSVPTDFATIQAAIDDPGTMAGDTITVEAGIHMEGPVHITKAITLAGTGIGSTFIEPTGSVGIYIDTDGVTLRDFTIRVGSQAFRFEIAAGTIDGTTFLRVQMLDFTSRGIEISNATTVTNLLVDDCELTRCRIGLRVSSSGHIDGAEFRDTLFASNDIGLYEANDGSSSTMKNVLVTGCTFMDHTFAWGGQGTSIFLEEIQDCTIESNTFIGNRRDIQIFKWYQASIPVSNLVIRDNTMTGTTSDVFAIFNAEHTGGFDPGQTEFDGVTFENNTAMTASGAYAVYAGGHAGVDAGGIGWDTVHVSCNTFIESGGGTTAGVRYYNPGVPPDEVLGVGMTLDVRDNWWGSSDAATVDSLMSIPEVTLYTPYLFSTPGPGCPCRDVSEVENCGVLTASLEGPDLTNFNNIVVVHYNAGVTPGTANITNVAFLEVRSAQFATSQTLPDPENYALNVVLPVPTSDGSNLPPSLLTIDSMSTDFGEPGFGGIPAIWTVDYYDSVNTPGNLAGARYHTVLFGNASDGVCDLVQTFSSPVEQFAQTVFKIEDGIYHSINNPEVDVTTAKAWGGAGFTIPVPGLVPVEPFLYGETTAIDIGNSSDPSLLTGTADPGFVTVWTADFCTTDTLASVTTNIMSLELVSPQPCYKEDDIIEIQLEMLCLNGDVTGFFCSVDFDPTILELQNTSAYTLSPFPLHINDPIVDSGGGVILLDGSDSFGGAGTTADSVLASLFFKVLPGNDGVTTTPTFTVGGVFPNELSYQGNPIVTALGDPTGFTIDQSDPVIVCPADIDVGNDPGLCSAALAISSATATDDCDVGSIVGVRSDFLALDDPYPAGCAPGEETIITWTATDCAGNTAVCMQSVKVTDDEDPVQSGVPADIQVSADAGLCTAVVTWTDPTATDNCDPSPSVVCVPPSGSTFSVGTTMVTCTATDACGNESMETFDVEVLAVNEVDVEVELVGVNVACSRCIHFVATSDCNNVADETLSFADHDGDDLNENGIVDATEGGANTPSTPVRGSATIEIGCGVIGDLCAKDEQHTLWDTTTVSIVGTTYVADSLLSLEGGDTDNDGDCDINDVTLFIFQFGDPHSPGGCPWDGTRDSDFSDNLSIGAEDYTFLVANFLTLSSCSCTIPVLAGDTRVLTSTLPRHMRASVDLDDNGVVDHRDVRIFEIRNALPNALSSKMRASGMSGKR